MSVKHKILVTDGLWQGSITTIQSLGRQGHDIYLVDHDPARSTARSKYCKKMYVGPHPKQKKEYVDFVIDLLKREKFDLLVPIGDQTMECFAERKQELLKHTNLIIPDHDKIMIADDKRLTADFAQKNDVLIPISHKINNLEDVERISKLDIFPCIVKMPSETASHGLTIINKPEYFIEFYQNADNLRDYTLVQKFVQGDIYGSTAVCHEGNMLNYFMFYVPIRYGTGGAASYYYSSNNEELLKITQDLVRKLNWTGFIDFDFLQDEKGDFLLLEINPRLSGGSHFAHKLGVDLPLSYLNLVLNNDTKVQPTKYRDNVQYRLLLPVEVTYHLKNYKRIHKSFFQIFNVLGKTNINWTDVALTKSQLQETWWSCRHIIKNKKFIDKPVAIPVFEGKSVA